MAPQRIGRYRIQGEIGREGDAVLYRGLDFALGRPVTLKVVHRRAGGDAEVAIEQLRAEARAAARLHHPHIVAVYEYGEDDDYAWLALEAVEGRSLAAELASGWRPAIERLPSAIEEMLLALDHAHACGVVHGALDPGCVLIGAGGTVKVAGFGQLFPRRSPGARRQSHDRELAWAAPEQLQGQAAADARTDIYRAALVAYTLLAGRPPFAVEGHAPEGELVRSPPPPASTFEPRLAVSIDLALARALAPQPEARWRSAREFLEALRAAFPDAPAPPSGLAPAMRLAAAAAAAPGASQRMTPRANLGALRRALASSAAPVPEAVARPAPKLPSVLFVDDEERVLNALRALARRSFEVETASGGAQALARLRERRFHVLVSDQRMPGMSGVELLREARALAPDTVRLLLTGYADLAAIVGSVNEGEVFRYVSKPWQDAELAATLAEAADVAIALEARAAAGARAPAARGALLVLGDAAAARAARELARGAWRVHEAATTEAALEALVREDIAVLVCDLEAAGGDAPELLKALKRASPQTQLVALSASADADTLIGLVNEARIARFLKKPLNVALLGAAIEAAFERSARVRAAFALARIEQPHRARESHATRSILARLKALGERFGAAFRS